MPLPSFVVSMFSVGLMVLGTGVVSGQTTSTGSGQAYPIKTIRIVTSEPGGNSDFHARLIATGLASALGQSVIVENRPGRITAAQTVSRATPDGYSLFVAGNSFWFATLLEKMPYDPVTDFSAITLTTVSPSVLVVHPSLPVKSVQELIAWAKARPGELNYAAAAIGSPNHLGAELFKAMAGVKIQGIPYKSAGAALNDMVGGHVQLMFGSAAGVAPHVKAGRLRALAVTTAQPSALFPDLPTVAASLLGFESGSMQGLFAPAKTPVTIINRLNQEVVRMLKTADVKERLLSIGVEAVGSSPGQFLATIKADMARMGKLIKDAGIRVE